MKDKSIVQKERLKEVIIGLLNANIEIMKFHKTLTNEEKSVRTLNRSIRQSNKAIGIVREVEHIEILQALFNSFVAGKENYFVMLGSTICSKNNVIRWDKSEKGFQEFVRLENEAHAKTKQEYEERLKQQEIIKKAKEDGKKIEFAYKNGKLEPIIVSEKTN